MRSSMIPHRFGAVWAFAALPLVVLFAAGPLLAAVTAEQKKLLTEVNLGVRKSGRLLDAGKSRDAAGAVKQTIEKLTELAGEGVDADLLKALTPLVKQLAEVHAVLELDGLKLPPLPKLEAKSASPPSNKPDPNNGMISFASQVGPLLATKCGRCHIDDQKGKVDMSTYAKLMEGHPTEGVIIMPGKGTGSRVYELIESGDMPRGGGKLNADEVAMLVKWIDQGAKNDTGSDTTSLRQLARAAQANVPQLEVAQATGNESVKFSLHVAPVLVEQCNGCHGTNRPRARFSVETFARLLRGGDSGQVIVPGKPAESLLIQKLKGMAGARMPLERPPLPSDVIARFETWIAEGAKFDGEDDQMPLVRLAALARANTLSAEELSQDRLELSKRNWRLAIPDDTANIAETKNFLLVGNVGPGVLEEIGELAEAQIRKVALAMKAPADAPLIKGRLTVYVFAQRFDYSELGTMVEKRTIDRSSRGHWMYDIVDPYIAVVKPKSDEYSLETLLAQQLGSIYLASKAKGKVPAWFAEGGSRAMVAKMDKDDPRVASWETRLGEVIPRVKRADDFMTGKAPSDSSGLQSYSFVTFLQTDSRRYARLIKALNSGDDFEAAMAKSYGRPSAQLAPAWLSWARR